ncbi:cache domain-containing protein [Roseovarius aestuariivivens]|uniref:cache domain-containing protein n=1 Tax=Roseovarius aestuariivivens TaxID=1888910 RepID=UPI0010804A16|nr:cache domain-containing protein [Roseovarius aestuariivivens]
MSSPVSMPREKTLSPRSVQTHAPRLATSIVGFVMICGLIGMLAIWWPINHHARDFEARVEANNAIRGAKALRLAVSRALEREWDSLQAVVRQLAAKDDQEVRAFTDAVVLAGGRVAWAGLADLSGTIRVGSNGLREGASVSDAAWYRQGLRGPFFGELTSAKTDQAHNERDFLNISLPVESPDGEIKGVYTYSLKVSWLKDYVRDAADELGLLAYLVDQNGHLVFGPDLETRVDLAPASLSSLSLNIGSAQVIEDKNGVRNIYAVAPELAIGNAPPTRLSVVVSVREDSYGQSVADLSFAIWISLLSLLGLLAAFSIMFTRHFVRPLERLTETARDIAEGKEPYPEEYHTSRESERLSNALSRIQSRYY